MLIEQNSKRKYGTRLAESDITVEASFSFPPSDHIAMETRCVTAEIRPDGFVVFSSPTQSPYMIKEIISRYFNLHSEFLFVFERAMDMLAKKLDMDPLELRKKNAFLPGHTTPTQIRLNESTVGNLSQCIERLKQLMNWKEGQVIQVSERKLRVKGVSCIWKTSTIDIASFGVVLTFNADGSVNILSGIVEIGTGTKMILAPPR